MAVITAENKTLVHELLGLFQGGTFDWFDYNDRVTGVVTSVPITNRIDFTKAIDRLAAIFLLIEASTDGRQARIEAILADYKVISLSTARIGPGGAAGAGGVRYDPEDKRVHLRTLLWTHLGLRVEVVGSAAQGAVGGGGRVIGVGR